MPVLHIQYSAAGQGPGGQQVNLPPAVGLAIRGPLIQCSVSVAQPIAAQLTQQNLPVGAPVSGEGLIDTGASVTCIDDQVAQNLHLPVVDVVTLASASHPATQHNVYPIRIEIVGLPIQIPAIPAVGAPLAPQGLIALIGRDVLSNCTLFYNGVTSEITLSV